MSSLPAAIEVYREILNASRDYYRARWIPPSPRFWGYASNEARHVKEGRQPTRDEAEFVVGVAAVIATCLTKKRSAPGISA